VHAQKNQLQDKYNADIQSKDKELAAERKERNRQERESSARLENLQQKMEAMLKQREVEIREELDGKIKTNKSKFHAEITRLNELVRQREHELDNLEKQLETLQIEKSAAELQLEKFEVETLEY
jgi:chromosome segregation ATPase